jgi:hypothetical protein
MPAHSVLKVGAGFANSLSGCARRPVLPQSIFYKATLELFESLSPSHEAYRTVRVTVPGGKLTGVGGGNTFDATFDCAPSKPAATAVTDQ